MFDCRSWFHSTITSPFERSIPSTVRGISTAIATMKTAAIQRSLVSIGVSFLQMFCWNACGETVRTHLEPELDRLLPAGAVQPGVRRSMLTVLRDQVVRGTQRR